MEVNWSCLTLEELLQGCAAVGYVITKYIITVCLCPRLTLVCFMEFLLSEFLYFYLFALMLVCFISDLGFVPTALSKFYTFMK